MLRASTLISSADHLRPPLPNFDPKPTQNPRLWAPRPPRSLRLLCQASHSDGSISTARAAVEESTAYVEGDWVCRGDGVEGGRLSVGAGIPSLLPISFGVYRMSLGDQAFFLLAFIATTASIAFTGLVIAAVPTLYAMKRAATSLAKLADTAREELPSTMAAIRLSGMEISDLTLELSDLSQEIADGVSKSAQAVQAAEAGIRQIGTLACRRTMSMIEERASLPNISVQPMVVGAARKTSRVVGQATRSIMNLISQGECSSENEEMGAEH